MTSTDTNEPRHPLDEFIPDPTGLAPLYDEPEFSAMVDTMVADEAPRLFAVVQEYGDRVDAAIAAWGLAFADHAELVTAGRRVHMDLRTPEHALRLFSAGSHLHARLVWFDPNAATPAEGT